MEGAADPELGIVRRAARRTDADNDEAADAVQVGAARRGRHDQGSGGAIFVLFAFAVLVTVSWWGLVTAVMGPSHANHVRVIPAHNAREVIELSDSLQWDAEYAAKQDEVGWVLEDKGSLLLIGFADGTEKWYPDDALEEVKAHHEPDDARAVRDAKKAKRKKKVKGARKKTKEPAAEEVEGAVRNDVVQGGEEAARGDDFGAEPTEAPKSARKKKKKKKKKTTNSRHDEHEESGGGAQGDVVADAGTTGDSAHSAVGGDAEGAAQHEEHGEAREEAHDADAAGDAHSDGTDVQDQEEQARKDLDNGASQRQNSGDAADGTTSQPATEHADQAEEADHSEAEQKHGKKKKKKGRRHRHKKHSDGSDAEDEAHDHSEQDGYSEGGHQKKKHRKVKRHGNDEDSGGGDQQGAEDSEGASGLAQQAPLLRVEELSLESAIPFQGKKTCTYPVLHPRKWQEKMGWGIKKDFPPCQEGSAFSSFERRGVTGGVGLSEETKPTPLEVPASLELAVTHGATLTFELSGGAVRARKDDEESVVVSAVTLKPKAGKWELKVKPEDGEADALRGKLNSLNDEANSLEQLRVMLNAAAVPHTIPRLGRVKLTCDGGEGKVYGMDELPDKFFTKMTTTLDAEKRQNQLKNMYTTGHFERTSYRVSEEGVADALSHPYIIAECGGKQELHINLDATGRRFRREPKTVDEESAHPKKNKLNVMHIMFDSSSFPALVRACPKIRRTLEELNNKKNGVSRVFSFKHLHAVSCCSPGNQIPIYSGRMNGEGSPFVSAEPRQQSKNWLWNIAKTLGYNTFFSLDNCPDKSARDYHAFPSVDHRVVAPTCMAGILLSHKERPCLTNRPIDSYVLNAVEQFWDMYPDSPKFAAAQLITPHEPTEKLLIELDDPFSSLLQKLEERGVLNDTAVFFFSDHGINFGKYASTHDGEIEKMFPFAHIVLPRWLAKGDHPVDFAALRANQDALVTPYDLHELLRSLLHYPAPPPPYEIDPEDPPLPRPDQSHIVASMKTLRPFENPMTRRISMQRSCPDANIPPEFCTCIDWTHVPRAKFSGYDAIVEAAVGYHAEMVADQGAKCEKVALGEVHSVDVQVWPLEYHPKEQARAKKVWMSPNRDMVRVVYSIEARKTTRFEAIVSVDKTNKETFDVATVTRIDAMEKKCGVVEKAAELLCVCV